MLRGGALPHWLRGKEVLEIEPARYFVRVIKREKLACHKCPEGGVVTAAAGGPKIVEKGKLSDAVVVDVLIKKYLSHLPLYRQAADLHRDHGIDLSRSTLNAAVMAAGELLLPVAAVLKHDLLEGGYIQADETPIGVQSDQTRAATTKPMSSNTAGLADRSSSTSA